LTRTADFWSRRKAAVEAEAAAEDARAAAAREAAERAEIEAKSDAEILRELDLPDPDTLGAGDDFRTFMAKAVPERLRQKALRRLWLSNPTLANVDGLVDYGQDFTDAAMVIPDMRTVYKVGQGMIERFTSDDTAEGSVLADGPAAELAAEPAVEEAQPAAEEDTLQAVTPTPADAESALHADADHFDDMAEPAPPPRRHMRFAFNG